MSEDKYKLCKDCGQPMLRVVQVKIAMRDGPDIRLRLLRFGSPIMPHMSELHELADLVRWREGDSVIAFDGA